MITPFKRFATNLANPDFPLAVGPAIIIIWAAAILLYLSMFIGDYVPPYDLVIYSIWANNFSSQLFDGELYPRWLQGMNHGLGQPTFFIYSPLLYYIASLFYCPEIIEKFNYFQMHAVSMLGLALAGSTFFLWIRNYSRPTIALFSAITYMAFNYQLVEDIFMRGAVGEQWSFVWMPLALLGVDRLLKNGLFALPALALTYAAMVSSHLITAFIFTPFLCIYFINQWFIEKRLKHLLRFAFAVLLAVSLVAIYLLPVIEIGQYTNLHSFISGNQNFEKNFLFELAGDGGLKNLKLQMWIVVCVGLAISIWFQSRKNAPEKLYQKSLLSALAIFCLLAFFMTTPASAFIWNSFHPLKHVQYPWRYSIIICLCFAAATAMLGELKNRQHIIVCAIVALTSVIYILPPSKQDRPDTFPGFSDILQNLYSKNAILYGEENPEHFCNGATGSEITDCIINFFSNEPQVPLEVEGKYSIGIMSNKPREMKLHYDIKEAGNITIPRLYFHNTTVTDSNGSNLPVSYDGNGFIVLNPGAGSGDLEIRLPHFQSEKVGALISSLAFAFLLCLILIEAERYSKSAAKPNA